MGRVGEEIVFARENRVVSAQHTTRTTPTRSSRRRSLSLLVRAGDADVACRHSESKELVKAVGVPFVCRLCAGVQMKYRKADGRECACGR